MANVTNSSLTELYENGSDMGVFYPVHHVFVAFPGAADAQAAREALLLQGFPPEECRLFSDREVAAAAQRGLDSAPFWAATGASWKDVDLQHRLALDGCHFLLVKAATDAATEAVMRSAHASHFRVAQKYHRLVIERLH